MKREIKFRGRRLDNGEWVYGFSMYWVHSQRHRYNEGENVPTYYVVPELIMLAGSDSNKPMSNFDKAVIVDPATVGQYTGLKDVNGVEIYEGDIVDIGDDAVKGYYGRDTVTVEWVDKYACFGQEIKRSVEDVENELDVVVGEGSISPDDYEGWYDYIGSYVIDLCHMLRPSFSQPVPEFAVLGNIHDNPELLRGGEE